MVSTPKPSKPCRGDLCLWIWRSRLSNSTATCKAYLTGYRMDCSPRRQKSARKCNFMRYPPTPAFAKAGSGAWDHRRCGTWLSGRKQRHTPSRQHLCQLHAPAISTCSCRTLTPTYPCHLFFRTFKTAVCPPSNPPNASAGLQGNNSYSYYMPLPSVFQGVQDCRLPALKPPKRFRTFPHASKATTLTATCPAICFSRGSRLPFARPQTSQTLLTLPQASKATTLTATCPCHLFFRGFKTAVCPPFEPREKQMAGHVAVRVVALEACGKVRKRLGGLRAGPTLPQASKATTLTATCPCHLFFRGFKTAVASKGTRHQGNTSVSYMPSHLHAPAELLHLHAPATCFFKPPKRFQRYRRPPRQQLLHLHAPAICFSGGSRLPFARPQTPQTLPTLRQASKATTLDSYMSSNPPNASNPLAGLPGPAICFSGVQDCRLPALKPPKRFQRSRRPPRQQLLQLHVLKPSKRFQPSRRPPRQQLLQLLHAPAICFSGGSRLPFARPQTPQTLPTLPQASKATTLTATCPCHLFFRGFKTAVCPPSNPPNASNAPAGLQGNNSYSRTPPRQQLLQLLHAPAICFSGGSRLPFARPQTPQTLPTLPQASKATTLTATCPCHLFFTGFKTAVCPASNPPNASNPPAGLQGNNSYSYMPLPSVFQAVQNCRLPALKPPKRFQRSRRPPRQQLLQLHVPAICFSGGSRLPSQAKAHAIKATPLSATCPAIYMLLPNSYTYMPLPPVFQDVQDYRLPGLKPSKRFRRPPRQQLLQLLHAPAICFSGGSRLPFARLPTPQTLPTLPQTPQTLPTLPQASKATTLTATCPQTLQTLPTLSQASKATTLTAARLQGNNSYSYYMPLPSVFQGVQDCRLPALKPPKRFQRSRRPPRQQLLQLHAPAICFSGGSRLPFARPQTPQPLPTLPQASKATTLTATCPCHLFFRGFKTAVASKGTRHQGNTSVSYMPSHLHAPAELLHLHAPATCFSGRSRLPFARPQTLQTLPQASKATTLTAPTCPCHLFFRGFKTAVCPPSNPPNASNPPANPPNASNAPAGLQGNNSYSYMSSNPPNASNPLAGLQGNNSYSRTPPRQQLLQLLHAPAICFSGGSRLPFARPQTPQTLPTLPQASKATTLTATCPCHLFFRGFKTAVCPPSNPPNASNPPAGLQGNNSYSRTPPRQQLLQLLHAPAICFSGGSRLPFARPQTPQTLPTLPQASKATTLTATCPCHLFFRGFKTAVCPASNPPNPPKRFRRPPRQQLLQLHAPAICFSGGSRLPFARPQTPQTLPTLPQASKATTRTATTCPCHICFSGGSRLPFARPQTPQTLPTLPQAYKATTLTATCPCHLFFRGFKTAVCPPSNPPNASAGLQGNNSYSYMPLPSVFQGVQDCRLPALKPPKRFQPFRQASKATTLTATCPCHLFFRGFKTAVCLPSNPPKPPKRFRRPPRQQLLQLHAPAICFSGGSRLPFARPQTPQTLPTLPQASKATTLTATTCPCHLFFRGFKTAVCPASNPPNPPNASAGLQGNNSYSYYMPLPSVFQGVQDCRLPALKPPKRFQPFRRPPRQQLLQLLHAPAICFSGGSRLPFARPQTPQTSQTLPQASKATTLTATCPCHLFFKGFKTAVCPPSNPPNASNHPAGLQGNNSYSYYMPLPSVFQGVQDCRLPALKPPKRFQPFRRPPRQQLLQLHPLPSVFQGVHDCRLPGLKPSKRFRRPPRQQLLQLLHAPAICFSGGSRLPFARPQTPQTLPTLPQASKATTLTATCPCHLFFRGFKTAVCPPSNPPNASNPPAGLQGNNSYSYMSLPSVFQGVQDCRLPGLKPPKRFQPSRRPPRQQLLQLHAPAICFSGGSSLPGLKPSKRFRRPPRQQLLQLHAPAICFSRGFKTAVCPASNPPNASNPPAGLQGNNSYSYMPLPSVFQGVQDCRLPALKPPKRFQPSCRPPRQQLLQLLHAPAICFSGGSRLPFARPQTPQTLPTLPQASKATTLTATCPCHLFFRGFKTAVCPASNPPNASAGLQGNNFYYSYMPLPSVFQGVQDCRLPGLKPPKRFRRPPRQQLLQLHAASLSLSLPLSLGPPK